VETPNPDKPEEIATKARRHKEEQFIIFSLRVLVSSWRKYFVGQSLRKHDVISINRYQDKSRWTKEMGMEPAYQK